MEGHGTNGKGNVEAGVQVGGSVMGREGRRCLGVSGVMVREMEACREEVCVRVGPEVSGDR